MRRTMNDMRFSTRSEYGIRAIIELARHWGGPPVSIHKVAETTGIPYQYLEQLVQKLRRSGIVQATRGVQGGYTLKRDPHEISVGDILRSVEGKIEPYRCPAVGDYQCARQNTCLARHVWSRVAASVSSVVDNMNIASLMNDYGTPAQHP